MDRRGHRASEHENDPGKNIPAETRDRFLPRHPITSLTRLKLWPMCWRADLTVQEKYALWDALEVAPSTRGRNFVGKRSRKSQRFLRSKRVRRKVKSSAGTTRRTRCIW